MRMNIVAPPKHRRDFDVAIICALPVEADAAEALFDLFWDEDGDRYGKASGDQNAYRTGLIGNHNVVLTYMPGIGKSHAASVAASFRSSFPGIRLALVVGICGGVPDATDHGIFLGDIIISDEIVIYDLGRRLPGGFRRKDIITNSTGNQEVRAFLHKVSSGRGHESLRTRTHQHLTTLQGRTGDYLCPPRSRDRLFESGYNHKHHSPSRCGSCRKDKHCRKAHESTCELLKCDPKRLVPRSRSSSSGLDIHFGRIASGDTVMKSGVDRDRIATEENAVAFEMEGAGICSNLPCLVVKGVCDYADSHKDKTWQKYTAGAAAACMKALLEQWASLDPPTGASTKCEDSLQTGSSCRLDALSELTSSQATTDLPPGHGVKDSDILQVLPTIKKSFKDVLSSFRQYKKYLPRDTDLKNMLKTQRVVLLNNVESISSTASGSIYNDDGPFNKTCLELSLAITQKLEEIEDITKRLPVSTKAKVQPRCATDTLKDAVEDLESLVRVFASSTPRRQDLQPLEHSKSPKASIGRHEFHQFRMVQKAAYSLYDAFGTACNVHTIHTVHLSLQPDLSGASSRVRFNVALIEDPATPEKTFWIDVESTFKSGDDNFQLVPISGEARSFSSLKRARHIDQSDSPVTVRKRVHFQPLPDPVPTLCPENTIMAIPNLYLQRNLCTVLKRSLYRREGNCCIGLLGDNEVCKHLAYIGNQINSTTVPATLSQLISLSGTDATKGMGLYERIRLSKYLATAVLYYHATPWLNKAWRSDDIHFFDGPDSLLKQPQHVLPYISTSVQPCGSTMRSRCPTSEYDHIIRNPVLFGLGVMFLELAYEAPLRTLQKPVDLQKGETQGFADYFTAHRLVDNSYRMVSRSFKMIVKQCLHCDFGHGNDLASPALQEAFYHDVILGLDKLETLFRELQLDDLEYDPA